MPSPAPVARLEWLAAIGTDPRMPKAAFAVASVLATFPTAPGGELFPSNATLAKRSGITGRSVRDGISRLRCGGYLAVKIGGGRAHTNVLSIIETRKPASLFEGLETRNEASALNSETRKPGVSNPENQRHQTRNDTSADPGTELGIEPGRSDGDAFDVSRWERRAGAYGKGAAQRKETVERLRAIGASDADLSQLFTKLPSPGALGKAEAAARFDAAVEALCDELSATRRKAASGAPTLTGGEKSLWRARISGFFRTGFWPSEIWGPKLGEAGCSAPADVVEECRAAARVHPAEAAE